MEGYPWTIHRVEVRCPCGIRFGSVNEYLQHKEICTRHQEDTIIGSNPPSARRRAPIAPAEASFTTASQEPRAFFSNPSSKSSHKVGITSPGCSSRRQRTKSSLALSSPALIQDRTADVGFMPSVAGHSISPPRSMAKIHCVCGRDFAKQAALDMHLQTSKIHHAGELKLSTPKAVQPATQTAHSPLLPQTTAPLPGTIPHSNFSVAQLIRCTCGQSFETQRILDLHKRDSMYHQRHNNNSSTPQTHQEDSLTSAFSSISLYSESAQILPAAGGLTCVCGCIFSTQEAFDQHNVEVARYVQLGNSEAKIKRFGNLQMEL
ncbi:hypothetical protein C7974DRAFT_398342 [Boeremia exigua]|uniref:uncharacterized protein n=1 Tax=Boeremia exigua TaxID=749465 RepID=UPI001E8CE623|nr:uncharacterized protein C7974DRAFT_398342 [Boeremia exigua]KAH6622466.1 hypothetical protein C7974DRAFT_398342 [Boeremia exigua]